MIRRAPITVIAIVAVGAMIGWGGVAMVSSSDNSPGTYGAPSWNDPVLGKGEVGVWVTTPNKENLLTFKDKLSFQDHVVNGSTQIKVDEDTTYQEMDGFGGSFTDSAAWLVYTRLDEADRDELMTRLFDYQNGIGISFLRQPMGSPDFARRIYSYDDMPRGQSDLLLKKFSIDHDRDYIIPALKAAIAVNPGLKVMVSPWSPPGWMKTSDSMIGGSLRPEPAYRRAFADYFVRFIQAYQDSSVNIPIYAITVQNEPLFVPTNYPGMSMTASDQVDFIDRYLGPALAENGMTAKIFCYDHNWDGYNYAMTVLGSSKFAVGSAWHYYSGIPENMSAVHLAYPDKGIWFTEAGSGSWNNLGTFHNAFMDQMKYIIRIPRNYAKTIVWWNLALDENNGPIVFTNTVNRGIVTVNKLSGRITYNVDYYTLGHISRFVKPGALRIKSNTFADVLEDVAFKNPDGSIVLIISNRKTKPREIQVQIGTKSFTYMIPAEAGVTFKWTGL